MLDYATVAEHAKTVFAGHSASHDKLMCLDTITAQDPNRKKQQDNQIPIPGHKNNADFTLKKLLFIIHTCGFLKDAN